jgi:ATP-binding protein involved in chromosome partitioning
MPDLNSELILAQLRGVKYPGYSRDIVSFGMIKDVQIDGSRVWCRSPSPRRTTRSRA